MRIPTHRSMLRRLADGASEVLNRYTFLPMAVALVVLYFVNF